MSKFNTYTDHMLYWAINDCHATLREGQYDFDHPYSKKIWAEIDAIRAVQMARADKSRAAGQRIIKRELAAA
jgi:hypothetical protein